MNKYEFAPDYRHDKILLIEEVSALKINIFTNLF